MSDAIEETWKQLPIGQLFEIYSEVDTSPNERNRGHIYAWTIVFGTECRATLDFDMACELTDYESILCSVLEREVFKQLFPEYAEELNRLRQAHWEQISKKLGRKRILRKILFWKK